MTYFSHRRALLLAAAAAPFSFALGVPARAAAPATEAPENAALSAEFAALEGAAGDRLGVCAINTANSTQIRYRADERFAFCSTFKVMLAGAVLAHSNEVPGLLAKRINYAQADLVNYSPVSSRHVADGMTVAELCAAAIQYSDNSAANLLIKLLGGPEEVTEFARSIDDPQFRLDRWETELNSAVPGDPRDTTTPAAMAHSLQALAVGSALAAPQREQLQAWLRGNTTGAKRIQAGLPSDWKVGDKTGTGDYGTTNDIAVAWPPSGAPFVIALYFTQRDPQAKARDEVLAAAAGIISKAWR
jgi:beta-lactamase class A